MKLLLGSVALLSLTVLATAEIEKTSVMTSNGMKLFWWPRLSIPNGWDRFTDVSHENGCNMLGPKGSTFDNAPAVIYSRAFYLPSKKERGTVQQFIQEDLEEMKDGMPGAIVKEIAPTSTHATKLRTFSVVKTGKTYEQVCYGIEGPYRILFCVSAKSEAILKKTLPVFQATMAKYK